MASQISQIMSKIAQHVEGQSATTGITKCIIGMGGEAKTPFARVVKSGGSYLFGDASQGDINSVYDKTFLIEFGFYGTEEQTDLAIETFENLWLPVSQTEYQELHALGVWRFTPKQHNHPFLLQADQMNPGVLGMELSVEMRYS